MRHSRRHFLVIAVAFIGIGPAASSETGTGFRRRFGKARAAPKGSITPQAFSAGTAVGAINEVRAARGSPALSVDGTLNVLAAQQARELVALQQMSHTPRGLHLKERARSVGFAGQVAENLADGYETFEEAIRAWIASGYHRTTMLSPRYSRFGAAVAVAPDAVPGDWGIYWVTEFGA